MQTLNQGRTYSRARFYASLYLLISGIYLFTASGRIGMSDSVAMLNVAQSIKDQGSLSSEPCRYDDANPDAGASIGCIPGRDGKRYAGYGLVPSLVVVPVIAVADTLAAAVHADASVLTKTAVSLFTLLLAPLTPVLLAAWILRLGYTRRTALVGAGVLAFASPYWGSSVPGLMSETYFTPALVAAGYLLTPPVSRITSALSGLAFGIACGCRLNGVIVLPAFLAALAQQVHADPNRVRRFVRYAVPFLAALSGPLLLIALANYLRFGSPLKTGYHLAFPSAEVLLSTPLFTGLYELLLNGEVGLFRYVPWALCSFLCFPLFARRFGSVAAQCGGLFVIYLLFFAKYADWHGGWVAGPRFLTPTLPFLVVFLAPAIQFMVHAGIPGTRYLRATSALLAVAIGVGFVAQCAITTYPMNRYYALAEFYAQKAERPWWSGSMHLAAVDYLWHIQENFGAASSSVELDSQKARQLNEAAYAAQPATTEEEYLAGFPNAVNYQVPDFIWLKLRFVGLPQWLSAIYLLGVAAVTALGAYGLWSDGKKRARGGEIPLTAPGCD